MDYSSYEKSHLGSEYIDLTLHIKRDRKLSDIINNQIGQLPSSDIGRLISTPEPYRDLLGKQKELFDLQTKIERGIDKRKLVETELIDRITHEGPFTLAIGGPNEAGIVVRFEIDDDSLLVTPDLEADAK